MAGLCRRVTHRGHSRRAVEDVFWGMPAVNYDLMLQEFMWSRSKERAELRQLLVYAEIALVRPKLQTCTVGRALVGSPHG
jgi:hypothetical protein